VFPRILSILLACGAITALAITAYLGLAAIPTLAPEVAAAVVTALVGLSGILYAQRYSKKKEIADSHRPAKIEVYETFLDIVDVFMAGSKSEQDVLEDEALPEELVAQFSKLSRGLIVWASSDVIRAWNRFRERADNEDDKDHLLFVVDDVLQAIRKDLGNSNFGLKRGDVVKMYLSQPRELDELRAKPGVLAKQ